MKKTNLFFYKGELRTPGAIWRGIWNIPGTEQSRIGYLFRSIKCLFGFHSFVEDCDGESGMTGRISCSHCGKDY